MYEYCISKRTSTNILQVAIIYNLAMKILTYRYMSLVWYIERKQIKEGVIFNKLPYQILIHV